MTQATISFLIWECRQLFMPPMPRYRLYSRISNYVSLTGALLRGQIAPARDSNELENHVSRFVGVPCAMCVNQARLGIYLAVKSLVNGTKRKVILSPYTIFDVINMVIAAGGIPVFADIERSTCNINPDEINKLIDAETAAVLVTHLHGLTCEMDRISDICEKSGVVLIEDASQAFASAYHGRFAGAWGDVGVFSFGLMKNVNSFHGGMAVANNVGLLKRMREQNAAYPIVSRKRLLRRMLQGLVLDTSVLPIVFKSFTFWLFRWATLNNNRALASISKSETNPVLRNALPAAYAQQMSSVQAQIALAQIPLALELARRRTEIAELYFNGLKDIPDLLLPPRRVDGSHTYMAFPVQAENRDGVLRHLMRVGRDCAAQHLHNCADLPCFSQFARDCPEARKASQSVILLPTYPGYGHAEAQKTIDALRSYFLDRQTS